MTFCSTISAVPCLGSSCSSALSIDGIPGSGLKLMRLVNRQLRAIMLDVVQGFTLHLDGRATGLLEQMNLLGGTQLTNLRVVVKDDYNGERKVLQPARLDCSE